MKKDMPLEGLRWSRDSGSVLYDTPKTAVLGRAGRGEFYGSNGRISAVRAMMSSAFTKSVLCFLMISSISF